MSDTPTAPTQPPSAPAPHGTPQGLLAALTGHQRAFVAAIVAVVALLLGDTGLSARVGSSGVEAAEVKALRDEVKELKERVDAVDKGITDINYAIKEASAQGAAIESRLEALVPSVEALTRDRYVREELDKIRGSRRGRVPTRAIMDDETGDSDGE